MINKVILVGNVGKDPDIRYFENDQAVANFTLATTERGFTARNGQEIPERTEWHNIVAWRGLAKLAENYIRKGSQLYIEGKLRTRSYDDANGVKKYTTEIFADTIQLLGRRGDNPAAAQGAAPAQPQQNQANSSPANNPTPQQDNNQGSFIGEDEGFDDLPF